MIFLPTTDVHVDVEIWPQSEIIFHASLHSENIHAPKLWCFLGKQWALLLLAISSDSWWGKTEAQLRTFLLPSRHLRATLWLVFARCRSMITHWVTRLHIGGWPAAILWSKCGQVFRIWKENCPPPWLYGLKRSVKGTRVLWGTLGYWKLSLKSRSICPPIISCLCY